MRIFKTKAFNKWAKELIADTDLLVAACEITKGNVDASLGHKIYKKRIALASAGKSGGARTIVAFQEGNNLFYMYGFEKSERANISNNEKRALQKLARIYLEYNNNDLNKAVKANLLVEILQEVQCNG